MTDDFTGFELVFFEESVIQCLCFAENFQSLSNYVINDCNILETRAKIVPVYLFIARFLDF